MPDHPAPAPATSATEEDLRWMRVAYAESVAAHAAGDWPTGAVLVRDGAMLGAGRNRQNSGGSVLLHAEPEAIRAAIAAQGPDAARGATLYCTMEPCPMCAGALKLAGVTRMVLALRHATLRRTDLGSYCVETFCDMTDWHPALTEGVMRDEYLALRLRWGGDQVAPASGAD